MEYHWELVALSVFGKGALHYYNDINCTTYTEYVYKVIILSR